MRENISFMMSKNIHEKLIKGMNEKNSLFSTVFPCCIVICLLLGMMKLGMNSSGNTQQSVQSTLQREVTVFIRLQLPHCKYFVSFAALNCFHISIGNEEMVDASKVGRK